MEAINKNKDVERNVPFDIKTYNKPAIQLTQMQIKVKENNQKNKIKQKSEMKQKGENWENPNSNEGEAMAPESFSTTQPLPPKKNNNIFWSSPEEIAAFSAAREKLSHKEIAEQKRLSSMKLQEALASIRGSTDTDNEEEDDVWDCAYQRFGGGRTNRALSRGTF
jgi:hypothetical protein